MYSVSDSPAWPLQEDSSWSHGISHLQLEQFVWCIVGCRECQRSTHWGQRCSGGSSGRDCGSHGAYRGLLHIQGQLSYTCSHTLGAQCVWRGVIHAIIQPILIQCMTASGFLFSFTTTVFPHSVVIHLQCLSVCAVGLALYVLTISKAVSCYCGSCLYSKRIRYMWQVAFFFQ